MKRKAARASTPLQSKRQKAGAKAKTKGAQSSIPPHASLLGLPVELRLRILEYILPDLDIIPIRDRGSYQAWHPLGREAGVRAIQANLALFFTTQFREAQKLNAKFSSTNWKVKDLLTGYVPLRHNLESCWPNILQVNHQLYQEALPLMYKGKTFKAKIADGCLNIHGHIYHNNGCLTRIANMTTQLGKIESISLALHYGRDGSEEEIMDLSLLTASFANSLANARSLKRLHIGIKVFESDSLEAVDTLRGTDGKNLKSILKPFLQFRNLVSATVGIQGWDKGLKEDDIYDDYDSDSDAEELERIDCVTSDFTKYLDKMRKTMTGNTRVTQKQPKVDLYLGYRRQHGFLFTTDYTRSKLYGAFGSDLLGRAWQACERADMKAYGKVLQDTRAQWRLIEQEANSRLDALELEMLQHAVAD
ncbi:Mitogen-activated protein kinase [Venturia nashicola]|uniref:Mitogen-activated protein kinase n=1 Tax=Venturia nashicola TaxID=86259 RepID=A0A4Z1P0H1_9PEZI|nr:Mitogen-activated protein kinase [Venturia nashicola]TLD18885.1 Mitogen-activated protein kinase [Venturia nashicola]